MQWDSRDFVVKDCDGRLLAFGAIELVGRVAPGFRKKRKGWDTHLTKRLRKTSW